MERHILFQSKRSQSHKSSSYVTDVLIITLSDHAECPIEEIHLTERSWANVKGSKVVKSPWISNSSTIRRSRIWTCPGISTYITWTKFHAIQHCQEISWDTTNWYIHETFQCFLQRVGSGIKKIFYPCTNVGSTNCNTIICCRITNVSFLLSGTSSFYHSCARFVYQFTTCTYRLWPNIVPNQFKYYDSDKTNHWDYLITWWLWWWVDVKSSHDGHIESWMLHLLCGSEFNATVLSSHLL